MMKRKKAAKSRNRAAARSKEAAKRTGAATDVRTQLPGHALAERLPRAGAPGDRERVEAELRRLTAIVRNSSDAVTIQTLDGEILAWNRGAELIYGYSESEAAGMNVREIIPPDLRQEAEALAGRTAAGEPVGSFETKRLTKDGKTINVWLTVTALVDAAGKLEAIATTERDITAVKHAEETIRVLQAELAHMSRVHAVGEFAAAMAHELNQPLCAIGTNAQAMQRMLERKMPEADVREAVRDILADVERASRVVQGLKDQLRRCEPDYSTLDINEVVRGIAPIAEALARSENAEVRWMLAEGLRPVLGDRIQLQQVLLNLVRNGLEAMSASKAELRLLTVETGKSEDGGLEVSVRDRGPGLSDDVAERMFEPFFTTKPDGMGMGLAICSSILGSHGGHLWASRNQEVGCTLHLSLPCRQEVGS